MPLQWILSILLFILAGIAEVGGGYLIWKAIRENNHRYIFIPVGAIVLIAYGFIQTLQPLTEFGRIFAIYGGFFIVLSYIWAYFFDGMVIDRGDIIGSAVALTGVCICWFYPRN
jgi:drug/metabolite transporter superfamily protein YnfA